MGSTWRWLATPGRMRKLHLSRAEVVEVVWERRKELDLRELLEVPLFMVTGESGWRSVAR